MSLHNWREKSRFKNFAFFSNRIFKGQNKKVIYIRLVSLLNSIYSMQVEDL